jgi:hypothetical protein
MKHWILIVLVIAAHGMAPRQAPLKWYKGNLHCHSTNSDGNTLPHIVASWYRDHGYDFVYITDHNVFTDPLEDSLKRVQSDTFLIIAGEELTGGLRVHANVFNTKEKIWVPRHFFHRLMYMQHHIDLARKNKLLVSFNHPNWYFSIAPMDLISIRGITHFELINGHPNVSNIGDKDHPSTEEAWDIVLSTGKQILGVAGDDCHNFKDSSMQAQPCWVMVKAEALTPNAILQAIQQGDLYVSTGPAIETYAVERGRMIVHSEDAVQIDFIGPQGKILETVQGKHAVHELDSGLIYTRARVTDAQGFNAWPQPVFMKPSNEYQKYEQDVSAWLPSIMEAEEFYRARDLEKALENYRSGLKKIPEVSPYKSSMGAVVYTRLARLMTALGKSGQGSAFLDSAASLSPSDILKRVIKKEQWIMTQSGDLKEGLHVAKAAFLSKSDRIVIDGEAKEKLWAQIPWTSFTVFRDYQKDVTEFKVCYDNKNLYVLLKGEKSDTAGLDRFSGDQHERISLHIDRERFYDHTYTLDNFSEGLIRASKNFKSENHYIMEYQIPVILLGNKDIKKGEIWNLSLARTHQKLGEFRENGWAKMKNTHRTTGWTARGGEAERPAHFGLLIFN